VRASPTGRYFPKCAASVREDVTTPPDLTRENACDSIGARKLGTTEPVCPLALKAMAKQRLPKFNKPPVVEAFCGVSFQEIGQLHAPQLGKFWNAIRNDFPKLDTQPPWALFFLLTNQCSLSCRLGRQYSSGHGF
jgi:hypothetical protein